MNRASFLQRLAAFVLDGIAIAVIGGLLVGTLSAAIVILGSVTGGVGEPLAGIIAALYGVAVLLVGFLLQFCYFGYLWSERGRSVGMGLVGIRVVNKNGGNPSLLIAGLRGTLGYYISGSVFCLGFLWILFDPQHEGWHDKIFGTQVIQG